MALHSTNELRRRTRLLSLEPLEPRAMLSITATIDYTYDTNNFFDTSAKKDLLQLAADTIVGHLQDDLSAITPSGSNTWSQSFFHPGTGSTQLVSNPSIAANEIVIYAGGRYLGGTLGQGGPGGYSVSGSGSWIDTVQTRGETGAGLSTPTDFGPWGGSVSFNTTTTWHFGSSTAGLSGSEYDFYSVAIHELMHVFGFGTADSFDRYVNSSANTFSGPESVGQYDLTGDVPLSGSNGHWASGTMDGSQEAAMDPSISAGTRKDLTLLDLGGLVDLGWEIDLSEAAQTKFIASDFAMSDWFGYKVDVDGDYAIVGSPLNDDAGSASGAAYVFYFDSSGNWVEQAKITAPDAVTADQFGSSVAIDGDTVVVGAWLEDAAGTNAGAAYVFQRDQGGAGNWGQVAKITGTDTTAADKFGYSVDISVDTIIVGAPQDDPSGSASGAAYIFDRNEGGANNWGEVAKLTGSDSTTSDLFAFSVGIDGDVAVAGSRFGDASEANMGSAFVYSRNQGGTDNWGQVKKLTASDGAVNDQFGYSVDISGGTVAVGARLDDDGFSNTGSVYIYDQHQGGTDNWGEVTKITADDGTAGAWYGASVSLDGDAVAVGAYFAKDGGASKVGAIYHHKRDQGGTDTWGQVDKLTAADAANNDRNGFSVGISNTRVISGAYLEDPNATTSAGSAYVYVVQPLIGETSSARRTVRKDPGGCGCGGAGCHVCTATSVATVDVSALESDLEELSAMATLPETNSDVDVVDEALAQLSDVPFSPKKAVPMVGPVVPETTATSTDHETDFESPLNSLLL